jgi:hypothetical protein
LLKTRYIEPGLKPEQSLAQSFFLGVADGHKKRLGSGAWMMVIVIVGVDVFIAPNVASKEYKGILRHLVELVRGAA